MKTYTNRYQISYSTLVKFSKITAEMIKPRITSKIEKNPRKIHENVYVDFFKNKMEEKISHEGKCKNYRPIRKTELSKFEPKSKYSKRDNHPKTVNIPKKCNSDATMSPKKPDCSKITKAYISPHLKITIKPKEQCNPIDYSKNDNSPKNDECSRIQINDRMQIMNSVGCYKL